ncbi:SRPBCC family protein [Mucilaginibacter antarcticus]|uniref:SRPBCC domain-containing protein n=1 Tax=Mucilaginibacter antarcticus TaxID=1855725 RepID=A0ABW5XKK4_9SPHI
MQDFNIIFTVDQTPTEVFEAVTNVRGWWSESLEGQSARVGDEFIYRHGDVHYSSHRLTQVVLNQKVVWLTTDGSINFVDDKTEWTDTEVVFEITEGEKGTTLEFTHKGLTPSLACYQACSGGWSHYMDSLHKLITTGVGQPDK